MCTSKIISLTSFENSAFRFHTHTSIILHIYIYIYVTTFRRHMPETLLNGPLSLNTTHALFLLARRSPFSYFIYTINPCSIVHKQITMHDNDLK